MINSMYSSPMTHGLLNIFQYRWPNGIEIANGVGIRIANGVGLQLKLDLMIF
jgi:hypothetical protein